jgi:predicted Holliday junction resolvase-like endonuclease
MTVLFTGITGLIENINLMCMSGRIIVLPMFTTLLYIVRVVRQVRQVQRELMEQTEQTVRRVQQVALEQMVLEDLPHHHQVREGLAKEAEQVEEEV